MNDNIKIKDVVWVGSLIIALLSWIFVTQGNSIDRNTDDIHELQLKNERIETQYDYIIKSLEDIKQELKEK